MKLLGSGIPVPAKLFSTEDGRIQVKIAYDQKTDLPYLRLDARSQDVVNRRVGEDIVLDVG